MRCVILNEYDFKDGKATWEYILDCFDLPANTKEIKVAYESHLPPRQRGHRMRSKTDRERAVAKGHAEDVLVKELERIDVEDLAGSWLIDCHNDDVDPNLLRYCLDDLIGEVIRWIGDSGPNRAFEQWREDGYLVKKKISDEVTIPQRCQKCGRSLPVHIACRRCTDCCECKIGGE